MAGKQPGIARMLAGGTSCCRVFIFLSLYMSPSDRSGSSTRTRHVMTGQGSVQATEVQRPWGASMGARLAVAIVTQLARMMAALSTSSISGTGRAIRHQRQPAVRGARGLEPQLANLWAKWMPRNTATRPSWLAAHRASAGAAHDGHRLLASSFPLSGGARRMTRDSARPRGQHPSSMGAGRGP